MNVVTGNFGEYKRNVYNDMSLWDANSWQAAK